MDACSTAPAKLASLLACCSYTLATLHTLVNYAFPPFTHGRTHRSPPLLLFGRARSRVATADSSARRSVFVGVPAAGAVSRVTGPSSCMHLSAPLDPLSPFSSGSRAGAVHSSHRLKTRGELDAAMHGRLTHLHVFMPKPPPRTEQRSMAACALPCGEARKLRRWATRSLLFIVTPEP